MARMGANQWECSDELINLRAELDALRDEFDGSQEEANATRILGLSVHSDDGIFNFQNASGLQAATLACISVYGAAARFCTDADIQTSVANQRFPNTINGVATWSNPPDNANLTEYCNQLTYNSGHISTGTTTTVNTTNSTINSAASQACGTSHPVLCCQ